MIKLYILLFLIFTTFFSYSQELPEYIRAETKQVTANPFEYESHHHHLNEIQEYGDVERRNYDVLRYDLYLDLTSSLNSNLEEIDGNRKYFQGINDITVLMNEESKEIEFDANVNHILYVIYSEDNDLNNFEFNDFSHQEGILTVVLPQKALKGDTIKFRILYASVSDSFDDFRDNRGMHIYHKGMEVRDHRGNIVKDNKGDPAIVEHNIAYSMSEPELARYWMPCNDRPYDKALSSMNIRVPINYTGVSNGLLSIVDTIGNDLIFHWENYQPIPTYLMNFAASVFEEYEQTVIVDNDTIPMLHYAWPEDMNGDYFKLIPSMDTHPLMMEVLTDNFGPYPFSRYGTVTVHPFPYGGMEHQTNVTQNRFWIRDNGDGGFVHEMGHHWFGNMITCATWADIWINEGGATFTEAMYFGTIREKSEYKRVMEQKINYFLQKNVNNTSNSMYAVPINSFFGDEGFLIYEKGAIFLNQMKENLGEEQFFKVVREILQDYKYKSITTDEFRQAWKEKSVNPKLDIDSFFEQWVYGAGNPEYSIESNISAGSNNKYLIEVNVSQVQKDNILANEKVPDLFVTPIRFQYRKGSDVGYSETFMNESQTQSYKFETDFLPTEVIIDQTSVVHFLKAAVITSVELEDYVGGIELFPNPITDNYSQLNLNIERAVQNARIELLDILGNKVKDIYTGNLIKDMGFKIFTNNLPSGIYIVNINLDGVHTSRKLIVQ